MEAPPKDQQGGPEEGLYLSGKDLRPPRPVKSSWGPHWDKETFQQEARREEMEVREVFKEIRSSI